MKKQKLNQYWKQSNGMQTEMERTPVTNGKNFPKGSTKLQFNKKKRRMMTLKTLEGSMNPEHGIIPNSRSEEEGEGEIKLCQNT